MKIHHIYIYKTITHSGGKWQVNISSPLHCKSLGKLRVVSDTDVSYTELFHTGTQDPQLAGSQKNFLMNISSLKYS